MTRSTLLMLMLSFAGVHSANAETGAKEDHFGEHKAQVLQQMDSARNCVQGAADHAGMKACHEQAQQARKAMHEQMRQQREQHKQEREERRASRESAK